ncbi:MAG TPA: hypothetical protein VI432_03080 [Candidatus Paceibacterota bacterium]
MYNLILQIIFMGSLGVIVYLFAIAVPRMQDSSDEGRSGLISRFFSKLPLHRVDTALKSYKDKTLRRLKVLILRADNAVSKRINSQDKDKFIKPPQ